jgi:outer membrane immunogenic protein
MKFLIVAAATFFGTLAQAADMPPRSPARPTAPAQVDATWQGMYVGLQGGWNLGAFSPVFGDGKESKEVNLDDNKPFVGGHIGYLAQSGGLVIGPELGIQYWGLKSQAEVLPAVPPVGDAPGSPAILLQSKIDWLAYANVRVGVTPFASGSTLLYVTGGAAWAHVSGQVVNVADVGAFRERSAMGWNVGAGLEFKLTDRLTFGGEYRHYDFGKLDSPIAVGLFEGVSNLTVDQVMGRLSYRLN